ncbi:hypothetical protein PL373_04115 [Tenacibaculum maritimum]|nr:hypothetical protein [Tenacibaculum maritimum]MDB0600340.1 hypothetical protein [Tenacibaculum maritimum]MDB0611140.1 hypothetical protein [Tenacibaculum maritimum]
MIIVSKYLVRKGYAAMAIFPFIFFRKKEYINPKRLNHEKIHLRQQLELLIIPFYIWYGLEFLVKWIKLKNSKKAYYNISFEKEAYKNEHNLNYLKNRKFYSFLKS